MILGFVGWFMLFGWWAGARFWCVRDGLRTGAIKTGSPIGSTVHRSTDPREFARVVRWKVAGGALWAAVALLPVLAIALMR
jgi:hypothetical protein